MVTQGEDGVRDVLTLLNEELVKAMRLTGCGSLTDIKRSTVVQQSNYSKL